MIIFTGCGKTSGGSSALLALLGGGGPVELSAPAGVTASNGSYTDRVAITWDAVAGATYYQVFRCDTEDGAYELISGDETTTSYDDIDITLLPEINYYYKVKAFNAEAGSEFSDYSTGMAGLAAPTDVVATDATYKDHIAVSWSAVTGADYYRVYRSTAAGGAYGLISGDETASSYDDDNGSLVASTEYFYKVKAFYGTVESPLSAYDAGGKGAFVTPNPPANVEATRGTHEDKVTVTWNASDGADYYNVFRADTEGGSYTTQIGGNLTLLTVDDTTGVVGTHYFYKVKAFDAIRGESAYSAVDSGRCELTHLEYLLRFNLNYEYYMTKLANTTAFPPTGLGTYDWSVNGAISGSSAVHIVATLFSGKAISTFTHSAYNDLGMTLSGSETNNVNFSGNGTHTGTMITGGTFTGAIVENLSVDSKIRYGGTFTVTYGGSSSPINFSSTSGPGQILPVPYHVSATQGTDGTQVVISWAPVYGATAYRVYRATTSGGTYSQIGSDVVGSAVAADGTIYTYNDASGSAGTHYFYQVRALNHDVNNDQDGDQTHDHPGEDLLSGYSGYAEGWR